MSKKAELIGNYFGTIYLTVISLLQGVALSQLIPNAITYFKVTPDPLTNIHLVPLILMLLIIFTVWHHYAIGIFFLRWFPNIIDTIIPFVISIGQFFLLSLLTITTSVADMDLPTWTIGYAVFFLLGCFPYFLASYRCVPGYFINIMSELNAVLHCQHVRKFYFIEGASVLFQGLFGFIIVLTGNIHLLLVSLSFFIFHIILSEYFFLRNLKNHFLKSIEEFDEANRS